MNRILLLFCIVCLASCSKKATKVELEIICFDNISQDKSYPTSFQELGKPMSNICDGKKDIGFSPFYLKRVDLNKKIEIGYLTNKTVNYEKIKAIERDYNKYFKDSSKNEILAEKINNGFSVSGFLNEVASKENYFIFSSDENLVVGNAKIYHSVSDLKTAIAKLICEKSISKVYVLYEPNTNTSQPPPPVAGGDSDDVKIALLSIINSKISFAQRIAKVNEAMSALFDKNFYVIMHNDDARALERIWDRGHGIDYLKKLAVDDTITGFQIIRTERNTTDNKVSHIEIVELHKN